MDWYWALLAVAGGMVIYRLLDAFTVGVGLWPRQGTKHWLHTLEGLCWPLTWALVFFLLALRLVLLLLGGLVIILDWVTTQAFKLGQRVGSRGRRGVQHLDPQMERRLDKIRPPGR